MAHNIITNSDRRPGDGLFEGRVDPGLPADGDAVLITQGDLGGPVTILFHKGLGSYQPSVVIHPWGLDGHEAARIAGEDLYAFRELLNELPEEAFVRPEDPVEEFFTIKDVNGDWWVWDSERKAWAVGTIGRVTYDFKESGVILTKGPDNWGKLRVSDDQEPRWTDGDIVKPDVDSPVTYVRRGGMWDRTAMGEHKPGNCSDNLISELVDNRGYFVALQQNA
jgi:hypothetical protein